MLIELLGLLHRLVLSKLVRIWFIIFLGKGKHVKAIPESNSIIRSSAVNLARRIRRKEISSVEVVNAFIDRIIEVNPMLNCVVDERYKAALQDAEAVDKLVKSGKYTEVQLEQKFPFLGVPISTKDHMAVKGMKFTCGIWARKDIRSSVDGEAIALMRLGGAIPFVLTNVPELCLAFESNNQLHGRTKNPYDSNRVAGGSSGGEGSVLSASGSPLGIGTDIGGSIRTPSFFNGIFGHKPSTGIVSVRGTFPDTHDRLSALVGIGPMSRFAEDLLPALKIIAGKNAGNLRLDEPVNLAEVKVFYQLNDGGSPFSSKVEPDIISAIQRAVRYLQVICVKQEPQQTQIRYVKDSFDLWLNHMNGGIDMASLVTNGRGFNPFIELIKSLFGCSRHTFNTIAQVMLSKLYVKNPLKDNKRNVKENALLTEFDNMLGTDGVFLYPTYPNVALFHSEPNFHSYSVTYTAIVNLLGLPSTAVPMGLGREGLPIGLQVIAGRNQDRLCLAIARELEKAFGGWVEPGSNK